jgi:thiol-disulfide isomerase/thioredoxin
MTNLRAGCSIAISLVLLSGCAAKTPAVPSVGEVVSCDSISRSTGVSGIVLPCLDGKSEVYISSVRGPAIVNVWGSWCAPCKEEIPFFREFYATAKGKVDLLGVDVEEAKTADGQNFVVALGMTWPDLFDPDGRTRGFFGLGVPVTWFIDSDGTVVFKKIGVLKSLQELKDLTAKYLHVTVS